MNTYEVKFLDGRTCTFSANAIRPNPNYVELIGDREKVIGVLWKVVSVKQVTQ